LKHCDGGTSVATLLQRVRADIGESFPEASLWVGLEELKQRRLLEPGSLASTPYDGLSRRGMLRRLGVAAATAPLIVAVAANPASAQSGAPSCQPANNTGSDSTTGCPCIGTFDCCGICSAGNTCTGAPRGGSGPDPGAAPSCFPGLVCFPANNAGNNSEPGCPCIGTFDCCGICSATGFCTGSPRGAAPGDPGAAPTCV
jgi:hypothetical protein